MKNNQRGFERRILQLLVFLAGWVPVLAGGSGMIFGADIFTPMDNVTFDSHFRYLSGLLFAIGIAFWSLIPKIEVRTTEAQLLTFLVFIGGIARLMATILIGVPSLPMLLAIGMEIIVTPALCIWQWRISKSYKDNRF